MTVNTIPLKKVLNLMSNSPFKASLPSYFDSDDSYFDIESSLNHASESDMFSNIMSYQKNKSALHGDYYSSITSKVLSNKDGSIVESLHADLTEDLSSTHLKVKLLNEFALAQINRDEKLLPFEDILYIQKQVVQLKEIKTEIEDQVRGNAKLISNVLEKTNIKEEDLNILKSLSSNNEQLSLKLIEVTNDIEARSKALGNQYLLALSISYFEDLEFDDSTAFNNTTTNHHQNTTIQSNITRDIQTEELLSYVVSLVVQRNLTLPVPDDEAIDSKSKWAKDCVDVLIKSAAEQPQTLPTLPVKTQIENENSKSEQEHKELKTAMSDLQFAHQFLTRQFEEERSLNNQMIQTNLRKQRSLENKLSENIIMLEKSTQRSILIEHEKNILESKLDVKFKEIQALQKQITELKLSTLGVASTTPSPSSQVHYQVSSPASNQLKEKTPTSPATGFSINLEPSSDLSPNRNPRTPLLQSSNNTLNSITPKAPERASVSIMRSEFKRIYNELQSHHEAELEREINERKRLEKLIEVYEGNENIL